MRLRIQKITFALCTSTAELLSSDGYPVFRDEIASLSCKSAPTGDETGGPNHVGPQFLRTGYPLFSLDPATSMNPDDKTVYPKRWKYDTGEITTNPENYQKAVDEQYGGYDGINKVPWWLQ